MLKLTIKHLLANKVRFALTTLGVTLAVSFVVSAFVLGDGLRSTFTKVPQEVTAGVDLEARNTADFGDPPPLPPDTVSTVAAVAGVADAAPSIESAYNEVQPIRPNGDMIPTNGPPQLSFNWIDNPHLNAFTIVDGNPPEPAASSHGLRRRRRVRLRNRRHYEFMTRRGTRTSGCPARRRSAPTTRRSERR